MQYEEHFPHSSIHFHDFKYRCVSKFYGWRHLLYGIFITFNQWNLFEFSQPKWKWQANSSSALTTNTCAKSILTEWKVGSRMCVLWQSFRLYVCICVIRINFTLYSDSHPVFHAAVERFHEHASNLCRWHTSVQFEVENRWCNVTAPTNCPDSLCVARVIFFKFITFSEFRSFW